MSASRLSQDVHAVVVELSERGCEFAVVVVLQADGSTPCTAGAKAVVEAGGAICGTVGGGAVEAEAQRRAVQAIAAGRAAVFDFNLQGSAIADKTPVCGGVMRVLVDPTAAKHRAAYAAAATARKRRQRGVLLTTIRGASEPDVAVQFLPEEAISAHPAFPGAEAVRAALSSERAGLLRSESPEEPRGLEALGGLEALVEPLIPPPLLVIAGGGHIGQALAAQASMVGFEIVVIDDRPEFADPRLFPEAATTRCGKIAEELAGFAMGADTYVVLVTRGHQHDAEALAACLGRPAAYLGMIGSRRKVTMVRQEFLESGRATAAEFDRVYAPIGLDIGAATVPEIATSILAQLIAVRRRGTAPRIPEGDRMRRS